MMRTILKSSLVWAGILLSFVRPFASQAQKTIPLGALPMQFNSSFAGEAESPRLNTNIGFTLPSSSGWSSRVESSYDQFVPALRSGIGVSSYYSRQASEYTYLLLSPVGASRTLSSESQGYGFAVAVAPKFSLKGKYTISPSLDFSYNTSLFSFDGGSNPSKRQEMSAFSIQSRAAILFNTQKWYVGYSVDLFTHREIRYSSADFGANLNRRFNSYWQFGYTFQRSSESKFSFTPQLLFRTGDGRVFSGDRGFAYFNFTAFNLNFRYQKVIW